MWRISGWILNDEMRDRMTDRMAVISVYMTRMYKNKNKGKKLENPFTSYLFGCLAFLVDDWLMLPIFSCHILYKVKKESTRDSFSTQVFINHAEDGS